MNARPLRPDPLGVRCQKCGMPAGVACHSAITGHRTVTHSIRLRHARLGFEQLPLVDP